MRTVAFFNNKGGVGKTSLAYHLAWMFADLGLRVLAIDLDPQANLTAMFLDEDRLEELWPDSDHSRTVYGALEPIIKGIGDIKAPHVEDIADNLGLVVGDLALSRFEDELSAEWARCLDGTEKAFRIISAFYRVIRLAGRSANADLALIDVGPNLGAINRSAIIGAEYVVVPLTPDLFSLQGLRNLGPTLRKWRKEWAARLNANPEPMLELPAGEMRPAGYVLQQHSIRMDRPVRAYARWASRIPGVYREAILGQSVSATAPGPDKDIHRLAMLKHYRSLIPMAQEHRKPIFKLSSADGAIGSHANAVQDARKDFKQLAERIAENIGLQL